MNPNEDYMGLYRSIASKLKKRMFKKPNVAEASGNFARLAKLLKDEECPEYSALFTLSQANCESSRGNKAGEAAALVSAGQLFLEAEKKMISLKCVSVLENLDNAYACYNLAVKLYNEMGFHTQAAGLLIQLADAYVDPFTIFSQALSLYNRAAKLTRETSRLMWLSIQQKAMNCQIRLGNYWDAVHTCADIETEIMKYGSSSLLDGRPEGVYSDILASTEVFRVLLILIAQPPVITSSQREGNVGLTLCRYTITEPTSRNEDGPLSCLDPDLHLCLQSLVLACQSNEQEVIESLLGELQVHLTPEQVDLLILLWREIKTPSGEPF